MFHNAKWNYKQLKGTMCHSVRNEKLLSFANCCGIRERNHHRVHHYWKITLLVKSHQTTLLLLILL